MHSACMRTGLFCLYASMFERNSGRQCWIRASLHSCCVRSAGAPTGCAGVACLRPPPVSISIVPRQVRVQRGSRGACGGFREAPLRSVTRRGGPVNAGLAVASRRKHTGSVCPSVSCLLLSVMLMLGARHVRDVARPLSNLRMAWHVRNICRKNYK